MYDMGLSVQGRRDFQNLLKSHHWVEVQLSILNMNHDELTQVSNRLLDGQVTFDGKADITRGLDLDLLDPTHALHLDSNSPNDGAMFADRMLRVRYSILNPAKTIRYTVPVFTGPIAAMDRSDAAVSLQCLGKESMGMAPAWNPKTFKKGVPVTDAIKDILRNIIGENKYSIPDLANKLPRDVAVGGTDKLPWPTAKRLAASLGWLLYYDGMGVARMRRMPSGSTFTFTQGPGGCVKTNPEIGFDIANTINAVEVFGKKPAKPKKGHAAKKQPHARVVAERSHPLSPWNLGGDGATGHRKPRYLPEIIQEDSITTQAQANDRAKRRLAAGLVESVQVKFDSLTIPHLEEMDITTVSTEAVTTGFRLAQFAVPLTAEAQMSVGYVRSVKPKKSAIRTRR